MVASLTLCAGLSACASTPAMETKTEHFGQAVAHNIAAQRVAPTAEQKANTFIPPNRARQKAAREAYEKGETPDPVQLGTTENE
ncbi:hypothetical protein [Litorimonas sp. WD9-15]|uniref:hypothetical protein n=1 Tax=Litorimonas sp. WD9-15 TaxID=3418716 RepID=UPI003D075FC6